MTDLKEIMIKSEKELVDHVFDFCIDIDLVENSITTEETVLLRPRPASIKKVYENLKRKNFHNELENVYRNEQTIQFVRFFESRKTEDYIFLDEQKKCEFNFCYNVHCHCLENLNVNLLSDSQQPHFKNRAEASAGATIKIKNENLILKMKFFLKPGRHFNNFCNNHKCKRQDICNSIYLQRKKRQQICCYGYFHLQTKNDVLAVRNFLYNEHIEKLRKKILA